jgi:hypothetical protein
LILRKVGIIVPSPIHQNGIPPVRRIPLYHPTGQEAVRLLVSKRQHLPKAVIFSSQIIHLTDLGLQTHVLRPKIPVFFVQGVRSTKTLAEIL